MDKENTEEQKEQSKKERLRAKAHSLESGTTVFVKDFKSFAFKGDVIDLAVGVIIGSAFNTIVNSLAKDIIQPPIGKLLGNVAFTDLYLNLSDKTFQSLAAADAAGAPVIRYGLFLSNLINFVITALTLFIILRYFLRYKREEQKK